MECYSNLGLIKNPITMKKIISLSYLILSLLAFESQGQNIQKINVSMNGIDYTRAKEMIKNYQDFKGQDVQPGKRSVWFDAATFKNIVSLLNSEGADGLRIYFATEGTGPGRQLNTVVLVPTRQGVADTTYPSGYRHTEYFIHDDTASLFKNGLDAIRGHVFKKGLIRRGERLYKRDREPNIATCNDDEKHYITREYAEDMVQRFGTDTMTTNSEWFDKDLLIALAKSKDLEGNDFDGIRLYFGRHHINEAPIDGQIVAGKEAFVLVTTHLKGVPLLKSHRDFFNCTNTKSYFADKKRKFFGDSNPGGQDNGELCPTHCD
jgi:hypothetical protein